MLEKYQSCRYVGEVLIVNNHKSGYLQKIHTYSKVRVLNNGNNLFVNPSWNLGVKESKYDAVILANDDLIIADLCDLLEKITGIIQEGQIIGPSRNCFLQKRKSKILPEFSIYSSDDRDYGFGTFMIFMKDTYITIPEEMKVWFGDTFLTHKLDAYMFDGVDIQTPMRSTSKRVPLNMIHETDKMIYDKLTT